MLRPDLDPFVREALEPMTSVDVELLYQILICCTPADWLNLCVKFEAEIDRYLTATTPHRMSQLDRMRRREAVVVTYAATVRLQQCHELSHEFQQPNLFDKRDSLSRRLARAGLHAAFLNKIRDPDLFWPFEHENPWERRKKKS